jgi:hypothetical protein
MSCQSWNKELNAISFKEKTKCTIHTRAITDRICPEMDTLNWVLNEILESKIAGLKYLEGNGSIACCVILES